MGCRVLPAVGDGMAQQGPSQVLDRHDCIIRHTKHDILSTIVSVVQVAPARQQPRRAVRPGSMREAADSEDEDME